MLRKFLLAAALLALVIGPAAAQLPMPGISLGKGPAPLTPEEEAKRKAIDDAYRAANKKIPEKTEAVDPWGGVRPNPSASAKNKRQ